MGAFSNLAILSGCDGSGQDISAAAVSTNYIDLGVTRPQLGVGAKRPVLCIRTAAAPGAATDTLSIELQNDADSSFSDPSTICFPFAVGSSDAYTGGGVAEALASHPRLASAGAWICRMPLPYEIDERYLRLYYNNTVSADHFYIDAWLECEPASDHSGVGSANIPQVIASPVGNP